MWRMALLQNISKLGQFEPNKSKINFVKQMARDTKIEINLDILSHICQFNCF